MTRPVNDATVTCPVCKIAEVTVRYRPGVYSLASLPPEFIETEGHGSGPWCECENSPLVDVEEYYATLLRRATEPAVPTVGRGV